MRRLRQRRVRPLLAEQVLNRRDLVAPLFVDETIRDPLAISSMPGQFRYPPKFLPEVAGELFAAGVSAVLLFGIPGSKDAVASAADKEDGVVQRGLRAIRDSVPEMLLITDVCACEYTDHGHCGIIGETRDGPGLANDPSLELMGRIAVSHAAGGADIVAPSCMLDGQVAAIREALDLSGFEETLIMSYSAKFSSALFGPFREAAESGYAFGDRSGYQMNPANAREAVRESELDAAEGADILMVKPAGLYLDVLAAIKTIGLPVAAYQVSGEYAQIKAAAQKGWIKERDAVMESLICMKRAGADLIITYFAKEAAGWIDEEQ